MHLPWSFLPRSFISLVLPGRVLVLRYGLSPLGAGKLKERREYPLGPGGLLETFEAVRRDYKPSADDTWRLGLPLRTFTAVNFHLPEAASRNLDQAVHYALMSHLPFEPSEAYTHYLANRVGDKIDVSAVAALKAHLRPFLEAVSSAGITLASVAPALALAAFLHDSDGVYLQAGQNEVEALVYQKGKIVFQTFESLPSEEDEEATQKAFWRLRLLMENSLGSMDGPFYLVASTRTIETVVKGMRLPMESARPLAEPAELNGSQLHTFPYEIDLVPPSLQQRRRVAFWFQAAALLVLLLSLASLPAAKLLGKHERLQQLENRVAEAKRQANELTELRAGNEQLIDRLNLVTNYIKSQPEPAEILKEITELLPDDTWANSFLFAKNQIILQGETASATAVLEILEHSPLFKEVRFDSQITRRGERELYKIVARLE